MVSNDEQESFVAKRILRYLRDWYNQDVKRPVPVNNIAGNIGTQVTLVETSLKQMEKEGFVSCFKDLGGSPLCMILTNGLEHLENLENKQSSIHTPSLKIDVDLLIKKFEECLETLTKLKN